MTAAGALRDQLGAEITFLIQNTTLDPNYVRDFEFKAISFDENLIAAIQTLALNQQINVVVFDLFSRCLPENMAEGLSALRILGITLVGIDSFVNQYNFLDLLFIPSFRNPLPTLTPSSSVLVYGWDCFLLNVPKAPKPWRPGNTILALTGGADATKLGKHWPSLLNEHLPSDAELAWVTGPFAQPAEFPQTPRIKIVNHFSPPNLTLLMTQCQYAATVYGVSFFELLGHGIPTVVFSPYGTKDSEELDVVASEGLALVARDEYEATELLSQLTTDDALAKSLSERSLEKRLHAGPDRFVAEIAHLLG